MGESRARQVFWNGIRIACEKKRNNEWETYGVHQDESDVLAVSLIFVHVTFLKSQKLL